MGKFWRSAEGQNEKGEKEMRLPFEMNLRDKVAVVTGAGAVLCSSMAEALASCGAKTALLDLNGETAKRTRQKQPQGGASENLRRAGSLRYPGQWRRGKSSFGDH